jgi:hypothetical protein
MVDGAASGRERPTDGQPGERGQSSLEFILVFPLLVILFALIALQAWWWWNQTTAAVAIHDGTAAAGHHGGSLAAGYAEVRQSLSAALGGMAHDYVGTFEIKELPAMRATVGRIRSESVVRIPYLGTRVLAVEARSFQRKEQFYGGPPGTFE